MKLPPAGKHLKGSYFYALISQSAAGVAGMMTEKE
jgi:hypothetical protein